VDIYGVWAAAANDAWACGNAGTMLHWDGTAWSKVPSATAQRLASIYGVSSTDIWAAGNAIVHWDGHEWTQIPSTSTLAITAVATTGANDAWFADQDVLLHWDGVEVTGMTGLPFTVLPAGVFSSAPGKAWVVGDHGDILHN
jgi:hypothetical protein